MDSSTDHLALARALFERRTRGEDGRAAFRVRYPKAPEAMVHSAAFHVYVDGVDAALAFLARAELFLRTPSDPDAEIDFGVTYELLYHLYNWHQFQALLPGSTDEILELLSELKQFVADDDREAIVQTADELSEVLDATRSHPDFD